jgi:hypothetical protein
MRCMRVLVIVRNETTKTKTTTTTTTTTGIVLHYVARGYKLFRTRVTTYLNVFLNLPLRFYSFLISQIVTAPPAIAAAAH